MSRTYPVGRDAVVLQLAHRRCQEKHWTRPTARFTLFLFDSVPLPQMRWSKFDAKMGPTMANISLTQDRSKIRLYERPVNVKEAAKFLGVSPSLVYAYVERKQIPHFRMMGRAIRFRLSELDVWRQQFQEASRGLHVNRLFEGLGLQSFR